MLSKFRLGLLHSRIETSRFVRPKIPPEERVCLICNSGDIEDESYFLLVCNKYEQLRQILYSKIPDINNFMDLSNEEKLKRLLNYSPFAKQASKFIVSSHEQLSTLI